MESICYGNDLITGISIANYQKVTEFHSYRHSDLVPDKCGVEPVIKKLVYEFKPWYYDGKTVWWDKSYELRSEAEKAAEELREKISEYKILRGSEKNSVRPEGEA